MRSTSTTRPKASGRRRIFIPGTRRFYVIDGAVDFDCAGTLKKVTAGGFVHVPAGTVHSFRYASPTARVLGITSGAGASELFAAIDRECPGATPDMGKLADVLNRHQVGLAGQSS